MENEKFWEKIVAKILKTEFTKRDITYKQLVEKLEAIGVSIKEEDLRGRI